MAESDNNAVSRCNAATYYLRLAKSPALASRASGSMRSLAVNYSRIANATLPSSQLRFTSEFGMESGGSTALLPPGKNL